MNKIIWLFIPLFGMLASCNGTLIGSGDIIVTGAVQTGIVSPIPIKVHTVFIARGNEPFWAFEQTATGAKLLIPGQDAVVETHYTSIETYSGAIIHISAQPISTGSILDITITPGVCSDGMSDMVYNYVVRLVTQSESLNGCAQL